MTIQYRVESYKEQFYAVVTGWKDPARLLFVPSEVPVSLCENAGILPETMTGDSLLPVREISAHAFEYDKALEEVILPDTVRALRAFCFHGCIHLHRMVMSDSVEDIYDGAIRHCTELEEIRIRFRKKDSFRLLKDLLGDTDQVLPVRMTLPVEEGGTETEELSLVFPSFADSFHEDVRSRAIHERILGAGYITRQTVSRGGIDVRGYDRLFIRFVREEAASAVEAAFRRLMHPYLLTEEAKEQYETYLRENAGTILPKLLRGRKEPRFGSQGWLMFIPQETEETMERLRLMAERGLISETVWDSLLPTLGEVGDPELSSMLLKYRGKKAVTEEFSLDDF